jgi:hypothetical protein
MAQPTCAAIQQGSPSLSYSFGAFFLRSSKKPSNSAPGVISLALHCTNYDDDDFCVYLSSQKKDDDDDDEKNKTKTK